MSPIEPTFASMGIIYRSVCFVGLVAGLQCAFPIVAHAHAGQAALAQGNRIKFTVQAIDNYEPPDVGGPTTSGGSGTR